MLAIVGAFFRPPSPRAGAEPTRADAVRALLVLLDLLEGQADPFRCANAHAWDVDANNLIHAGSWCPDCAPKGERIVRGIFEATFGAKFPKSKPLWLTEATGRKLELDGYCETLSLAFEYQGPRHSDRENVMAVDALKRAACRSRGVRLVEVPAVKRPFPPENVLAGVAAAFHMSGIDTVPRLPSGELFKAELETLRELAAQRRGTLLSTRYLGSEPYEWKCSVPEHLPVVG